MNVFAHILECLGQCGQVGIILELAFLCVGLGNHLEFWAKSLLTN